MMRLFFLLGLTVAMIAAKQSMRELPANFQVSEEDVTNLITHLHTVDVNKPANRQIQVRWQGHKSGRADMAQDRFFKYVDPALLSKPTYRTLMAMFDNYDRMTGTQELATRAERAEEDAFMEAVFSTRVMQDTYDFLHRKRHPFAQNLGDFKAWVRELWFDMYSRARGQTDTSGFEHVFLGEIKQSEVNGLHNWVRFYQLEKDQPNSLDYRGFLIHRYDIMGALHFHWDQYPKHSSTMFLNTSPEFDFSLYTLCFLTGHSTARSERGCRFTMDGCDFKIISHPLYQQGKIHIGSAYPHADGRCRRINSNNRNRNNGRRRDRN